MKLCVNAAVSPAPVKYLMVVWVIKNKMKLMISQRLCGQTKDGFHLRRGRVGDVVLQIFD